MSLERLKVTMTSIPVAISTLPAKPARFGQLRPCPPFGFVATADLSHSFNGLLSTVLSTAQIINVFPRLLRWREAGGRKEVNQKW